MKNSVFTSLSSEFEEFAAPKQSASAGKKAFGAFVVAVACALVGYSTLSSGADKTAAPVHANPSETPAQAPRISIPEVPVENKPARKPAQKNAMSNKSSPYTGPRIMSEHKVAKILQKTGFPAHAIPKLVCTAHYESNYDVAAKNENPDGTVDTGLFQINDSWLSICGVTRKQLRDPKINSTCALKVYKAQGIRAWIAFRKKKEKCSEYRIGDFAIAKAQAQAQAQALTAQAQATNSGSNQPQIAMD